MHGLNKLANLSTKPQMLKSNERCCARLRRAGAEECVARQQADEVGGRRQHARHLGVAQRRRQQRRKRELRGREGCQQRKQQRCGGAGQEGRLAHDGDAQAGLHMRKNKS